MNYLNVDKGNHLYYDCSKQSDRWVCVMQEYNKEFVGEQKKKVDEETMFDSVYKIKIWAITLRELLVF